MKRPAFLLSALVLILMLYSCRSQKIPQEPEIDLSTIKYYKIGELDEIARPKGGQMAFHENVVYPIEALRQRLTGKIVMKFLVTKEGKAYFIEFIKRTDSVLDKAAIQTVKNTPFIPARKDDKAVNSIVSVPITYQNMGVIN